MEAGKPYIIKWDSARNLTETDLMFSGVSIENSRNDVACDLGNDRFVTFMGTYKKLSFDADDRPLPRCRQYALLSAERSQHRCPARLIQTQRPHGWEPQFWHQQIRAELRRPRDGGNHSPRPSERSRG